MSPLIQVWCIRLDADQVTHSRMRACLNDDERSDAAKFKVPDDRRRYETCRGAVRHILAGLLDQSPEQVALRRLLSGKPVLHAPQNALHFNVSHSANLALLAVSATSEVGVDVEHVRPLEDWPGLAQRVCSAEERAIIAAQSDPVAAFYRCWVGKEALLKCFGTGLSESPVNWPVLDVNAQLHSCVSRNLVAPDAQMIALSLVAPLPSGYVGAIAARVAGPDAAKILRVVLQEGGF